MGHISFHNGQIGEAHRLNGEHICHAVELTEKISQIRLITLMVAVFVLPELLPAIAMAAVDCGIQDKQLSSAQRTAMIIKCLNEASAQSKDRRFAEQKKQMICEQNARNKGLQGNAKADYIAQCSA